MSKQMLKPLYEIQTDFEELPDASNKELLRHIVLKEHYSLKLLVSTILRRQGQIMPRTLQSCYQLDIIVARL